MGWTESADYAELSQLDAHLLQIDHINNSGASASGTGSGPPETAVVERWPRGVPGLLRAAGVARLFGRSVQTLVWAPAWSVLTEGSERGQVVLGVGRSSAGVWGWRFALSMAASGGWARLGPLYVPEQAHLGPATAYLKGWARLRPLYVPEQAHPPRARSRGTKYEIRVGWNVAWTSKTPRTARPSWSVASGPSHARGRRHGPRDARWQRERVGRAVIRDVAIRAAPVRCPHK